MDVAVLDVGPFLTTPFLGRRLSYRNGLVRFIF
jgi:hypothetical protein